MRSLVTGARLGGMTNLAVLAPIKPGFVVGFETITYVDRLSKLLTALNSARVAAREASLTKPPFPDAIGRFGIIQTFRYAIVPPDKLDSTVVRNPSAEPLDTGTYRLSLNVTFDGGWEPYMRVIYRDIGTLLDALFCNCVGYPGSRTSSYDAYCRWVRDHELAGGLFYTDSSMTLGDQHYLERIERIQRETPDPAAADRAIAGFAVASSREQAEQAMLAAERDPRAAIATSLRSLKGFYRLSPYFPPNQEKENEILIRFARDVLHEFQALGQGKLLDTLPALKETLRDELAWFGAPLDERKADDRVLDFASAPVQPGIVESHPGITHGCLVVLRINVEEDGRAAKAAEFLAKLGDRRDDKVHLNVALTIQGLRALGLPDERLDALPPEFVEGMEARAGLLGDLRSNHPDNWTRPLRNWPPNAASNGGPIDLSAVHVVVVLRLADRDTLSADLHPDLETAIVNELASASTGCTVLSVQPMRSYREGADVTREHFGFVDGISQPKASQAVDRKADEVSVGELLLGYRNDRGDAPCSTMEGELLDNGTFLVVRKLRQRTDVLNQVLDAQASKLAADPQAAPKVKVALLERMMGRRMDGEALVPTRDGGQNDFDYGDDQQGAKCPFHSHVRRANPRDGRPYMPRILRRGMSYGARFTDATNIADDRGIVFMAYCGSIAEQFEAVQRWIAGGNSSGVSSSQADSFLAVPEAGDQRTFRFLQEEDKKDDKVVRIDLGDQPFVSLQWGLYLFVPSLAALRDMPRLVREKPQPPASGNDAPPRADPHAHWRSLLEDPSRSAGTWQFVRDQQGVHPTEYGLLVGDAKNVLKVLQDDGTGFSVCGYGDRMGASIGLGYLGLDDRGAHSGHTEQAEQPAAVNAAIESITDEEAFVATREIAKRVLRAFEALATPGPGGLIKVPVDLLTYSENVLAQLCTRWFGLPQARSEVDDPKAAPLMVTGGRSSAGAATPARCPGSLLTTSRYIFTPRPLSSVIADGKAQGAAVREAFETLLARGGTLGTLATKIQAALQTTPGVKEGDKDHLVARSIAGVMLGFPPTVYGNFLRTVSAWTSSHALWELQLQLDESRAGKLEEGDSAKFDRVKTVTFDKLIAAMRQNPVPEMIWRTAIDGATVGGRRPSEGDKDKVVVLGLASAMKGGSADDHYLMFGGKRSGPDKTVHACPGYGMAIGVLLGLLSGLLEAGELRPTGSPIQLTLIPRANPAASEAGPPR